MISEKVEPLCTQVDDLRTENRQFRMQLEQYRRRPLVGFSCIPETATEDTQAKIPVVTTKAGIDLPVDDTINSHRVLQDIPK